ncbi:MAG: aldehyde dehydrogenase (NADP(+)) [Armatimonadota bacterium]
MIEDNMLTGKHLIQGHWTATSDQTFQSVNPKTGEALPTRFTEAGAEEAESALRAALSAFTQTRTFAGTDHADFLEAIAAEIEAQETAAALIGIAEQETALPPARLQGELARTTGQLRLFARIAREGSWQEAVIDTPDPARQPLPKPDLRRILRPIGPVIVFDASNFPFAFGACGGDTASALAAGNPVIVKAHPGHAGTDEMMAQAVLRVVNRLGLPAGIFSLLQGTGTEIGKLLVTHPAAEAVGFTGSQSAGRALFNLASARPRPIPVFAEMGSVNPLVVLPGAVQERAETIADGLAGSITMGVGQFCTKPGLIFYIDDQGGRRFTELLAERLEVSNEGTLLYPALRTRFDETIKSWQGVDGIQTRTTGASSGAANCRPWLLETDSALWRGADELHEEAFGPAALLVRCTDTEDLLSALDLLPGQLTGSIHTGASDEPSNVRSVVGHLEARVGRVVFNGYPTGVEVGFAMQHGGPYPATTASGTTSVGAFAIRRFARPIAYQNLPDALLPPELQQANPLGLLRMVNGEWTQAAA